VVDVQQVADAEENRVLCDACSVHPAVYETTVTHASNEQTKVKLCIPHGQLTEEYKDDRPFEQRKVPSEPNVEIKEKFQSQIDTAEGRALVERLCDPDRRECKTRRLNKDETRNIENSQLRRPPDPERGMSL